MLTTNDCMKCLAKYKNTYYCSNVDIEFTFPKKDYSIGGVCCGQYQGHKKKDLPLECISVPKMGYKCSNIYIEDNLFEKEWHTLTNSNNLTLP